MSASCLACSEGVSVAAYCAANPSTMGCDEGDGDGGTSAELDSSVAALTNGGDAAAPDGFGGSNLVIIIAIVAVGSVIMVVLCVVCVLCRMRAPKQAAAEDVQFSRNAPPSPPQPPRRPASGLGVRVTGDVELKQHNAFDAAAVAVSSSVGEDGISLSDRVSDRKSSGDVDRI